MLECVLSRVYVFKHMCLCLCLCLGVNERLGMGVCLSVCLSVCVGCDCLLGCFGVIGCACDFVCLVMIVSVRELGY